jgi:hypothetical protein
MSIYNNKSPDTPIFRSIEEKYENEEAFMKEVKKKVIKLAETIKDPEKRREALAQINASQNYSWIKDE